MTSFKEMTNEEFEFYLVNGLTWLEMEEEVQAMQNEDVDHAYAGITQDEIDEQMGLYMQHREYDIANDPFAPYVQIPVSDEDLPF